MNLTNSLQDNINTAKSILPIGKSFDIITRNITFGETDSYLIGINGFCKQELIQIIFSDLQDPHYRLDINLSSMKEFVESKIGYSQVSLSSDWDELIKNVLSGPCILLIDGFDEALIIDTRSYPTRGVSEPDTEKIIKGSKDGFVETLLFNTNLIRRRIRSPKLIFEIMSAGSDSKTDIALSYMNGLAESELLNKIKEKLKSLDANSLTMGIKSLEELLLPKKWYHPLPAFFSTERPDVACSYLMEGYILIIVDNTPAAFVLPCSIFQFTQSPEDYYQNTIVGNYIRIVRFLCIILSMFLMPVFLLLASNPTLLPNGVSMLPTGPVEPVKVFIYVLIAEFLLDLFKYSSSHAPQGLSGSLSIVGGLLIGDVAVKLHWASTEVIFYSAATVLATLSLSSIELADSIRIYRLFLIILTGFFNIWGFVAGIALILLSVITTPSFADKSYFWPLCPFNPAALKTLLFRYSTFKAQPSKAWPQADKKKK